MRYVAAPNDENDELGKWHVEAIADDDEVTYIEGSEAIHESWATVIAEELTSITSHSVAVFDTSNDHQSSIILSHVLTHGYMLLSHTTAYHAGNGQMVNN